MMMKSAQANGRGRDEKSRSPDVACTDSLRVSRPLLKWFTWYCRRYLRNHFHSCRVVTASQPQIAPERPLVVFVNHASWWDPLVGLLMKEELFPDRQLYSPIDATALERYAFFKKLGFFGVDQHSPRGARQFLRRSSAVLRQPGSLLAVTAQGQFADVRQRPVRFRPGLGHLAAQVDDAIFLPLAIEYVFWEERLPEILLCFGEPIQVARSENQTARRSARAWNELFERSLETTQGTLAELALRRNPAEFECLLRGRAGQGGVYDWFRVLRARLSGHGFQLQHGTK